MEEDHSHCNSCIRLNKCKANSCKIIRCLLECSARFHACKDSEHALLCPNKMVPCINAQNGCPQTLQRKHMGSHLEMCPASVVHCTVEWNRWPLPKGSAFLDRYLSDRVQLDVALVLRDQRSLHKSSPSKKLPLAVSLTSPCQATNGDHIYSATNGHDDLYSAKRRSSRRSSLNGHHPSDLSTNGHGDLYSASRQATLSLSAALSVISHHYPDNKENLDICPGTKWVRLLEFGDVPEEDPPPPGLDLNLESLAKYVDKPRHMYTFLCGQDFRRDEYPWHYRNVHSEIHAGLNGWLEQRCPLAQYGCPFSLRKIAPATGGAIVHSEVRESFGLEPRPNLPSPTKKSPSLTDLPFPILRHIASYLDSFSLGNLALSCRLLREVCCTLLESRGIVVLRWRRYRTNAGEVTWRPAAKSWLFSTSFTPIQTWSLEENSSAHAAQHLQVCPVFSRNIKSKPYPLPPLNPPTHYHTKL